MMGWFLLLLAARAEILPEGPLRMGEEVVLRVTDDGGLESGGETVRVIHHPSTPRAFERAINITDARGRVTWTPETGGVAELRAGHQVLRVFVEPDVLPSTPIALLLLLGVTGVGMSAAGFVKRSRR